MKPRASETRKVVTPPLHLLKGAGTPWLQEDTDNKIAHSIAPESMAPSNMVRISPSVGSRLRAVGLKTLCKAEFYPQVPLFQPLSLLKTGDRILNGHRRARKLSTQAQSQLNGFHLAGPRALTPLVTHIYMGAYSNILQALLRELRAQQLGPTSRA